MIFQRFPINQTEFCTLGQSLIDVVVSIKIFATNSYKKSGWIDLPGIDTDFLALKKTRVYITDSKHHGK